MGKSGEALSLSQHDLFCNLHSVTIVMESPQGVGPSSSPIDICEFFLAVVGRMCTCGMANEYVKGEFGSARILISILLDIARFALGPVVGAQVVKNHR
jgi:hypothetical protein